jgi:hypothetical protein
MRRAVRRWLGWPARAWKFVVDTAYYLRRYRNVRTALGLARDTLPN